MSDSEEEKDLSGQLSRLEKRKQKKKERKRKLRQQVHQKLEETEETNENPILSLSEIMKREEKLQEEKVWMSILIALKISMIECVVVINFVYRSKKGTHKCVRCVKQRNGDIIA